MPSDKEILFSMIDREVDNLLFGYPMLAVFSGTIKSYVHSFLDPYLNFFMDGDNLHVEMASAFAKEEMQKKMEDFKKKFDTIKENSHYDA